MAEKDEALDHLRKKLADSEAVIEGLQVNEASAIAALMKQRGAVEREKDDRIQKLQSDMEMTRKDLEAQVSNHY